METLVRMYYQGVGESCGAHLAGAKQSAFGFHASPDGHKQFAQVRVACFYLIKKAKAS